MRPWPQEGTPGDRATWRRAPGHTQGHLGNPHWGRAGGSGGHGRLSRKEPCGCRPAQASSQSMPWLADLVQSSEGSLDVLPVQCLCEFLLHDAADEPASGEEEEEGESREQKAKKRQVGALPRPQPRPSPPPRPRPWRPTLRAPCPCRGSRSSGSCWAACRTCCWAPGPTSRPRVRCWTTSCGASAPPRWLPGCWPRR